MNILLVLAHPRQNSLTHQVAAAFAEAAIQDGHVIEIADLVAEDFDPVLREVDEPDWNDPDKHYSADVQTEMARVERNDATVIVFPVWWWSMPAVLKGWIDRVWNNGWAYGGKSYPHKKVLMIAIAGSDHASYAKRGYDQAMMVQLETGVLRYCGVDDARVEILYGALDGEEEASSAIQKARGLATGFCLE